MAETSEFVPLDCALSLAEEQLHTSASPRMDGIAAGKVFNESFFGGQQANKPSIALEVQYLRRPPLQDAWLLR